MNPTELARCAYSVISCLESNFFTKEGEGILSIDEKVAVFKTVSMIYEQAMTSALSIQMMKQTLANYPPKPEKS